MLPPDVDRQLTTALLTVRRGIVQTRVLLPLADPYRRDYHDETEADSAAEDAQAHRYGGATDAD